MGKVSPVPIMLTSHSDSDFECQPQRKYSQQDGIGLNSNGLDYCCIHDIYSCSIIFVCYLQVWTRSAILFLHIPADVLCIWALLLQ